MRRNFGTPSNLSVDFKKLSWMEQTRWERGVAFAKRVWGAFDTLRELKEYELVGIDVAGIEEETQDFLYLRRRLFDEALRARRDGMLADGSTRKINLPRTRLRCFECKRHSLQLSGDAHDGEHH